MSKVVLSIQVDGEEVMRVNSESENVLAPGMGSESNLALSAITTALSILVPVFDLKPSFTPLPKPDLRMVRK